MFFGSLNRVEIDNAIEVTSWFDAVGGLDDAGDGVGG